MQYEAWYEGFQKHFKIKQQEHAEKYSNWEIVSRPFPRWLYSNWFLFVYHPIHKDGMWTQTMTRKNRAWFIYIALVLWQVHVWYSIQGLTWIPSMMFSSFQDLGPEPAIEKTDRRKLEMFFGQVGHLSLQISGSNVSNDKTTIATVSNTDTLYSSTCVYNIYSICKYIHIHKIHKSEYDLKLRCIP